MTADMVVYDKRRPSSSHASSAGRAKLCTASYCNWRGESAQASDISAIPSGHRHTKEPTVSTQVCTTGYVLQRDAVAAHSLTSIHAVSALFALWPAVHALHALPTLIWPAVHALHALPTLIWPVWHLQHPGTEVEHPPPGTKPPGHDCAMQRTASSASSTTRIIRSRPCALLNSACSAVPRTARVRHTRSHKRSHNHSHNPCTTVWRAFCPSVYVPIIIVLRTPPTPPHLSSKFQTLLMTMTMIILSLSLYTLSLSLFYYIIYTVI